MPTTATGRIIAATAMLATLLTLHGCDRGRPLPVDSTASTPTGEPLTATRQTFARRPSDCTDDTDCSTVAVTWEAFERRPALNAAIFRELLSQLQNGDRDQVGETDLETIADQFLDEAAEVERVSTARWQLNGEAKRLTRSGDLLTVEINSYRYTGGAHGIPTVVWLNWDLAADERVALSQVVRAGAEQAFWDAAEAAHRRWLDQQTGIDPDYREIWPFQRSDDFRFGEDGLVLLYGVYVLGPYALGPVQLTIPWRDLHGVIRARYLPKPPAHGAPQD